MHVNAWTLASIVTLAVSFGVVIGVAAMLKAAHFVYHIQSGKDKSPVEGGR